jgi:hypothetical protein
MTDQTQGSPAPGWYADPSGQAGIRWWDGAQWTAHTAPLPATAPRPAGPVAPDAPIYGPFIWLVVFMPLLTAAGLLFYQPDLRLTEIGGTPTLEPTSIFSVGYAIFVCLGLVVYGLTVVFAAFDHRRLQRIGIRPFHWAFAFLGALVYIIGRSVMVHRAARPRGLAPIWALIGVTVANLVLAFVWTGIFFARFATLMQQIVSSQY